MSPVWALVWARIFSFGQDPKSTGGQANTNWMHLAHSGTAKETSHRGQGRRQPTPPLPGDEPPGQTAPFSSETRSAAHSAGTRPAQGSSSGQHRDGSRCPTPPVTGSQPQPQRGVPAHWLQRRYHTDKATRASEDAGSEEGDTSYTPHWLRRGPRSGTRALMAAPGVPSCLCLCPPAT